MGDTCFVQEGLKRLGWGEDDLTQRRNGDQGKVIAARRLRLETTMSQKRIAQPFHKNC